jgi:hypothetical protein
VGIEFGFKEESRHESPVCPCAGLTSNVRSASTRSLLRRGTIVFRDRMATMVEGLKIADKFNLHMYVSY